MSATPWTFFKYFLSICSWLNLQKQDLWTWRTPYMAVTAKKVLSNAPAPA